MPNLGATELLIIAVVLMVLFGSRKLPGAARSLGQSMRIFKAETKALRDEPDAPRVEAAPAVPAAVPAPVPASVPASAAPGATPSS